MTWNIHGSIGLNPRFDLEKVVALILRADPDIIALQEVDSRRAMNGDPFLMLQEMLGHYGVGAKSIVTSDGDYGQMLMSRWPLCDTQIHDISYGELEPRRAISTRIATPDGNLHVVATHLGLSIRERRRQARELLKIIGEATPFVLMGDFNDWFWPGSIRRILARILPDHSNYRTFPSFSPLFRLDRIYCRPQGILVQNWTDGEARHLSDHLPVIADIVLTPPLDMNGSSPHAATLIGSRAALDAR
jgi:endonuclease/exonuclease/phosphatase family metal-dependent hydrolase